MRIGTISYCTDQGLGILTKSFVDRGIVTDILLLQHSSRHNHFEWYPNAPVVQRIQTNVRVTNFVDKMDIMLFFETPFDWNLIPYCKDRDIKTVLMPMHECMPDPLPFQPDLILAPSLLDQRCYPGSIYLPIPVDVKWRRRRTAKTYLHNAGHLGLKGRNGTLELLQAMEYVESGLQLVVRHQKPIDDMIKSLNFSLDKKNVVLLNGSVPYDTLWIEGDVFVFPEKFNGLSLPLQEAYAAGMLVMAGDRFPMNQWLPKEPLIPIEAYRENRVSPRCRVFDEAIYNPKTIANTLDNWYGQDINNYSEMGRQYAEANSWDVLEQRYMEVLTK